MVPQKQNLLLRENGRIRFAGWKCCHAAPRPCMALLGRIRRILRFCVRFFARVAVPVPAELPTATCGVAPTGSGCSFSRTQVRRRDGVQVVNLAMNCSTAQMLDPAATCRTGAGSPQTKVGTCLLWVPPAPSWQLALLPRTKRDLERRWFVLKRPLKRVCIAKWAKAESEAQRCKPKGSLESESRSAISLLQERPPRYTSVGRS